jgi:hypothetical protein
MTIGTISVPHRPPRQDRVTVGSYGTRNYPPGYWRELHRRRDVLGTVYQDFRGTLQNATLVQASRPFSTYQAQAQAVTEEMRKVPLFERLRNPPSSQVPIVRGIVGPEGFSPWFNNINRDPGGKAYREDMTTKPFDHPHRFPGRGETDLPSQAWYPGKRVRRRPNTGFGAQYRGEWADGPGTRTRDHGNAGSGFRI